VLRDKTPGDETSAMEKRLALAVATAICLLLSVGCQGPAGLSEADRAAIRQAQEDFVKLMNARDFKGLAALYAEDAVVLPPNRPAVQGRAAIQAFMESDPPISDFRLQVLEVEGRADLAYSRETASSTLSPTGAEPGVARDKVLAIWRKQADGSWKVLRDTWNSDLPLPAPEKPATTAKKVAKEK
jgi:uncharacterized protein (TIGR02246 family)